MSDDKILFSILEIGYCSHMMYRAKYMLVSSHLCTSPSLPPVPSPVGNKWPFCNCIPLSWFFTLYVCSLRVCFKVSISLLKWSWASRSGKNFKFILHFFFSWWKLHYYLSDTLFRIDLEDSRSYETDFGWRNLSRGPCVTSEWGSKSQCAICHVPFSCLDDHRNLCWDQTSHPRSLSNDEQSSPAELHRTCSVSEKQPPNLSVLIQ